MIKTINWVEDLAKHDLGNGTFKLPRKPKPKPNVKVSSTTHWYGRITEYFGGKSKIIATKIWFESNGKPNEDLELIWNSCLNMPGVTYEGDFGDFTKYISNNGTIGVPFELWCWIETEGNKSTGRCHFKSLLKKVYKRKHGS